MQKRKVIENYIQGFLGSFISRYNDIDGYWAFGKLYAHAIESQCLIITIDLISEVMHPTNTEFKNNVRHWSEATKYKFGSQFFSQNWLSSAIITIKFNRYESSKNSTRKMIKLNNPPFQVTINIVNKNGDVYSASTSSTCRPHKTLFERQRHESHRNGFLEHTLKKHTK